MQLNAAQCRCAPFDAVQCTRLLPSRSPSLGATPRRLTGGSGTCYPLLPSWPCDATCMGWRARWPLGSEGCRVGQRPVRAARWTVLLALPSSWSPASAVQDWQLERLRLSGKRATWWAVLVLLGFYTGTWLNSAYHSAVGDALVLILAAVPTCIGTVLGLAAGRYVAARRSDAHLNPKENRGCGDPQTGP